MRETQERDIDGIKVSITPWPARRAIKNKFKIASLLGPIFGQLGDALGRLPESGGDAQSLLDGNLDLSKIGLAFTALQDKLGDDKFDNFLKLIFQGQSLNDREFTLLLFDELFSDNLFAFYKALIFALEVNYKDFFVQSGIGSLLKKKPTIPQKK